MAKEDLRGSDLSMDFGGESEDAFITRIRRRLRPKPDDPGYPGSRYRPENIEDRFSVAEKADLFTQSLSAVGANVWRVRTLDQLRSQVVEICRREHVKTAVASKAASETCFQALDDSGIQVEVWDDLDFSFGGAHRDLEHVNTWDVGIYWADYAVAETGSVVVISRPEQGRSVSLLPPRIIVLIGAEQLVYARRTVLERVAKQSRSDGIPSSITFITGPSRSADIEMDLSIGVHGPGIVDAILMMPE